MSTNASLNQSMLENVSDHLFSSHAKLTTYLPTMSWFLQARITASLKWDLFQCQRHPTFQVGESSPAVAFASKEYAWLVRESAKSPCDQGLGRTAIWRASCKPQRTWRATPMVYLIGGSALVPTLGARGAAHWVRDPPPPRVGCCRHSRGIPQARHTPRRKDLGPCGEVRLREPHASGFQKISKKELKVPGTLMASSSELHTEFYCSRSTTWMVLSFALSSPQNTDLSLVW